MRASFRPLALAAFALVAAAGCGTWNPPIILPPTLEGVPINDTPQNTMIRFVAAYERKVPVEYAKLLASDFRFTFSSQSDPALVATYGDNWGKDDEIESTNHLFEGFTNERGERQDPAAAISLSLDGASLIDDPARPDSGSLYKYVIVPSVRLRIEIAGTDQTIYEISAPHDFWLVRGDVALLDSDQEAGANRWYIRRWDDKSVALATAAPRLAALAPGQGPARITWGHLKGSHVVAR